MSFYEIRLPFHFGGRDHPQKGIKSYRKSILCDAGGAAVLTFRKKNGKVTFPLKLMNLQKSQGIFNVL